MAPNKSARGVNVVLTIAGLAQQFGGPSRSVPALAKALAGENVNVVVLACETEEGQSEPVLPAANLVRTQLLPVRSRKGRWRSRQNDFFGALRETAGGNETVIHDNGLWLPTNHAVASAARFLKRPLVISPRGMLSAWSKQYHGWKKRIAWALFQRRDFLSAAALHVTSEQEAQECRSAGSQAPIAIVPNGVGIPDEFDNTANREANYVRTALFLSRVHPKKGLFNLVEAWDEVRPSGWRVLIVGGDGDSHEAALKRTISARGLSEVFQFAGAVSDEHKWSFYQNADLFVLPSYSENFGIVIAEALASGVPVITTRGTPWQDLIKYRCGWWEEVGAKPLAHALREATKLTDEERREMGRRGRELVEEKYSWRRVALEMKSVYAWLLNRDDRPPCVVSY